MNYMMQPKTLVLVALILCLCIEITFSIKYKPCPRRNFQEDRRLFVATCDSRTGWKEFQALKVWNVTGIQLRNAGVYMENVCKGVNWGMHGYLTKPLLYLEFLRRLRREEAANLDKIRVILMDSDTFWAVGNVDTIWDKYDCCRGSKDMVLSTEMSCWVGRYCFEEDLRRWYQDVANTPSYSPFVNSGIVMGAVDKIQKMLEHVIVNNRSYFITYTKKHKFDDQYAFADYAIKVAPQDIALDYYQALLASFSLHLPGDPPEDGWPFVCKMRNGSLDRHCPNYSMKLTRLGHYYTNKNKCQVMRKTWAGMLGQEELESLAPDPVIWHGNGAGKRLYYQYGHEAFKCALGRQNWTESSHLTTYGRI